jgi:RNA polymerase sigma-70 factor (ECF subfamily)
MRGIPAGPRRDGATPLARRPEAQLAVRTDEELVQALQTGDHDSFGVLVARWERPLFNFVYRMISRSEDARDICQETFLRVLRNARRFKPGARFSTWMYQIALNLCRDRARKKRRWSLLLVEGGRAGEADTPRFEGVARDGDPAEAAETRERREAVLQALGDIPVEQREVLVLKEYEGMKFREIADVLGCPESTVKSRMYYGLNGLKSALQRRGFTQ